MRANIRWQLPCLSSNDGSDRSVAAIDRFAFGGLRRCGLALALSIASLVLAAGWTPAGGAESLDSRWIPWIGSWLLISDVTNETQQSAKEDYRLEIQPGTDGKSIAMQSFQGKKLLLETRIAADGSRQPLDNSKCSGWYQYSWSATGKRLLFESEASCPAEVPRLISGISIITDNRDWIDVQLMRSGEDRAISVRKYRIISEGDAAKTGPGAIGAPRFLAGTSLSVDEVIELSRKTPPELLEAAILEMQRPFKLNSGTLKRLSDAGVQPQIVDLMVALTYPEKFWIDRQKVTPVRESNGGPSQVYYGPPYVWMPFGSWATYGPYSWWYWGTPVYGYWGGGWYGWTGGGAGGHGRGDSGGGRLINGMGYSRVEPSRPSAQPRYAQPRGTSGIGSNRQGSARSPAPPQYNSGGSSSGGSAPSASPGGYHSGSSGGGGATAKPKD